MNSLKTTPKGLIALSKKEVKEVNGGLGLLPAIVVGCIIAAFAEIVSDWDNFERGFKGEPYQPK